ncbi:MAG: AI-2E family transporter [Calditrichaeota bacterium]|nr:AI-2E family transporter [Calditrichota bacterium]
MTTPPLNLRSLYFRVLVVIAALATAAAIYYLRHIVFLLFLAFLLAIFLAYVSGPLERIFRLPRWLAVLSALTGLAVLLSLLGFLLISPLANQATSLVDQLPAFLQRMRSYLAFWLAELGNWAPQIQPEKLAEEAAKLAGNAAARLLKILSGGIALVTDAITVLVLGMFLAIERRPAFRTFCHFFRNRTPEEMGGLGIRAVRLIQGWMLGQLTAMLFMGLFTTVAFWIAGIDYFLIFGILAALFSAIPYLGPALTALGPLIWAIFTEPSKIVWVLIIWVASQLLEGNLITPLIMQRYVRLSPLLVMIGILVMGTLFGFLGVIVAVPLTAMTCLLLGEIFPWWKGKMPEPLPATEESGQC